MGSRQRSVTKKVVAKEAAVLEDVRQEVLDELFNDLYRNRRRVYKVNFVRGVFFGVGSFLGGTIVVAALVWLASLFTEYTFISQIFESIKNSIPNQ